MRRLAIAFLMLAGCPNQGTLEIAVQMPKPAVRTVDPSLPIAQPEPGIIVDASDGSTVCERVHIFVYAAQPGSNPTTHPATAAVHSGAGFGTYDAEKRRCTASAVLPAGGGYWAIVEYPYWSAIDRNAAYYADGTLDPIQYKLPVHHQAAAVTGVTITAGQMTKATAVLAEVQGGAHAP